MAIYHFTSKIVSRANGQSVVASAAYRAAEELHDQRLGKTFDFTRKRGVEHTEILAPEGAPQWVFNREVLWNAVEQVERRKDAQLAREMEIALPVELSKDEQIALVREFAAGDRLYFLRNERSLGVKNGSLGVIEKIRDGVLQVRMDGDEQRRVVVDSKQYPHLEHGYAATIHKSQGSTVDRRMFWRHRISTGTAPM